MTTRQSTEPGTEAGRRMMGTFFSVTTPDGTWRTMSYDAALGDVLAIEAEARASLLAAVREGVAGLVRFGVDIENFERPLTPSTRGLVLRRDAVLALLDTLSDEQETGLAGQEPKMTIRAYPATPEERRWDRVPDWDRRSTIPPPETPR